MKRMIKQYIAILASLAATATPMAAFAHPELTTPQEITHTAEHIVFGPNHHIASVMIAMISLYVVSVVVAVCVGIVLSKRSVRQTVKQPVKQ